MILALATLVASQLIGLDDKLSEDTRAMAQPYWDCVVFYATDLEKSGGSASEVASAAKHACRERKLDLWAAISVDLLAAGLAEEHTADQLMVGFEDELTSEVVLNVLTVRRLAANDRP